MRSRAAIRLLLCAAALGLAVRAEAQGGEWEAIPSPATPGGYDVQVDVDGAAPVTLESFQSGLAPYGDWVRTGAYGMAWRPRVAPGWRPYFYGRWEWTNEGWLWVTDEPFGWATYHYGRWGWDGGLGWVWVPGYQWAPAWVSWRYGGDVVGWAPLAPGLSLFVTSYAFMDSWWTFIPSARFCGTPVWSAAYPPSRAWQFYGATRPAPPSPRPPPLGPPGAIGGTARPPSAARPTPGWGGPPPRYIEERSGRPVQASRIVAQPYPGAPRGRPGEIGVYRPESAPRGGVAGPGSAGRQPWPSSPPAASPQRPGAWLGAGRATGPGPGQARGGSSRARERGAAPGGPAGRPGAFARRPSPGVAPAREAAPGSLAAAVVPGGGWGWSGRAGRHR